MNRNNWYLWVGVFLFLAAITRFAYLASLPEDHCETLFGTDRSCAAMKQLGIPYRR